MLDRTRHYVYQRTGTTGQLIVDGVLYDTGTDNVDYPDVSYQIGRYDSSNGGASLYIQTSVFILGGNILLMEMEYRRSVISFLHQLPQIFSQTLQGFAIKSKTEKEY